MATDIVLRSVKAAALTHAEMDQNWESLAQTVDAVTSNVTVAVADQNKILEVSISSGTITLPTVANASGTDTDSFKITIKNINATSLTIDGNGSELIEGAASVALLENEVAEFSLSSGAAEWNITGFYNPNLVGITSTATEINVLDGITPTTTELNYVNGVTSAIQTQIDAKAANGANSDITSLSGLTTDLSIAQGGTAASTAAGARTSLDVDVAGTDNSTDVTLAGSPTYLNIAGQVITKSLINLTVHVLSVLPIANGGTNSSSASGARTNLGLGTLATLNSVTATEIDTNAVGQSEIASSSVAQGELITSIGGITIGPAADAALPGGLYGFFPQSAANASGYSPILGLYRGTATTYGTFVGNTGGNTGKAQHRYLTTSPPYNLGHGDIPLFIFVTIDNITNEVSSSYIADVPPWGYNGPTVVTPDYTDERGNKFVFERSKREITFDDVVSNQKLLKKYLEQPVNIVNKDKLIPITQEMKNRDMSIIPHPFAGDLSNKTVVVFDPFCSALNFMDGLYQDNSSQCLDEISSIIHSNFLKIDNSKALDAGFKKEVLCCGVSIK